MNQLTEEQIAALAPDAPSLSAGKGLIAEENWVSFGYNPRVLWGEIKGSGKEPYRTQIDLQNTGFKCSCPSRKFPCKHGLGLYLLFARKPDAIPETADEPAWVKEWMDKRSEKAEKKTTEATLPVTAEETEKKSKQKAKTQHKRLEEVAGGVAELSLWLKDLLRAGLVATPEKEPRFWEKMAARLADAKAPGLGNLVREFQEINFATDNAWQSEVLEKTAKIYLLTEAFFHLERLPEPMQEEIKSRVGIAVQQKDLLDTPDAEMVRDVWLVLGRQRSITNDNLTVQQDWLCGSQSGRYALILNFAFKNQPISTLLVPGSALQAELVFYPAQVPLRAVVKRQGIQTNDVFRPVMLSGFEAARAYYVQLLSQMPWIETLPVCIENLSLAWQGSKAWLRDKTGLRMPLPAGFSEQKMYQLLALSGGQPMDMCMLYQESTLLPLGLWWEGQYQLIGSS